MSVVSKNPFDLLGGESCRFGEWHGGMEEIPWAVLC
jgi:hypothetical protein